MSEADAPGGSSQRWSWATIAPVILVVGVAAAALWWWRGSTADRPPEPVSIEATGAQFTTLDQMVAASDLVVRGQIVDVEDGRSITDPANPAVGIRTQLAAVEVVEVLAGGDPGPLVVEQEAALLDGTPVRINGVDPLAVGEFGYLFLVRGDSDEFPYTAIVNEQGWVPVVDGLLEPVDPVDAVWSGLAGRPVAEIDARLRR